MPRSHMLLEFPLVNAFFISVAFPFSETIPNHLLLCLRTWRTVTLFQRRFNRQLNLIAFSSSLSGFNVPTFARTSERKKSNKFGAVFCRLWFEARQGRTFRPSDLGFRMLILACPTFANTLARSPLFTWMRGRHHHNQPAASVRRRATQGRTFARIS
jgi:hypothetical protein